MAIPAEMERSGNYLESTHCLFHAQKLIEKEGSSPLSEWLVHEPIDSLGCL